MPLPEKPVDKNQSSARLPGRGENQRLEAHFRDWFYGLKARPDTNLDKTGGHTCRSIAPMPVVV
jgi:hypothetical protein